MKCGRPAWPVRVQSGRWWSWPPRPFLFLFILDDLGRLFRFRLLWNFDGRFGLRLCRHVIVGALQRIFRRFRLGIVIYHNYIALDGGGRRNRLRRHMIQRQLDLLQLRNITNLVDFVFHRVLRRLCPLQLVDLDDLVLFRSDRRYRRSARTSLVDLQYYSRRIAARVQRL